MQKSRRNLLTAAAAAAALPAAAQAQPGATPQPAPAPAQKPALSPEQKAELRKRIGDRSNLVVAAAAAIAGEGTLVGLAGDLVAAFDRFLVNPLKDDKLCRAKVAIVQALDRMEHQGPDVFLRAARHVQFEPVWGGTEDSAPPLRAAALVATVAGQARTDQVTHLVRLIWTFGIRPWRPA